MRQYILVLKNYLSKQMLTMCVQFWGKIFSFANPSLRICNSTIMSGKQSPIPVE